MTTEQQQDLIGEFGETFPTAYTVEDTMRLCLGLYDEIKRLREIIDNLIKYGECDGSDACDDCLWDLWVDKYKGVASE